MRFKIKGITNYLTRIATATHVGPYMYFYMESLIVTSAFSSFIFRQSGR